MQVVINIDEKIFNLVAAQVMLQAENGEMEKAIEIATNRCKNETITIDTNLLEEESQNLQMGLCMVAIAATSDEEYKKLRKEKYGKDE